MNSHKVADRNHADDLRKKEDAAKQSNQPAFAFEASGR